MAEETIGIEDAEETIAAKWAARKVEHLRAECQAYKNLATYWKGDYEETVQQLNTMVSRYGELADKYLELLDEYPELLKKGDAAE